MEKQTAIAIIVVCLGFSAMLVLNSLWQNHEQVILSKTEYPYLIIGTNSLIPIRINETPFLEQPIPLDKNVIEILKGAD